MQYGEYISFYKHHNCVIIYNNYSFSLIFLIWLFGMKLKSLNMYIIFLSNQLKNIDIKFTRLSHVVISELNYLILCSTNETSNR